VAGWREEREGELERGEEMDVSDLTQLSSVHKKLEERLKGMGYHTIWDIAYADIDELAEGARVSTRIAKRMIDEARKLVND